MDYRNKITVPTLLLDEKKCKENIRQMAWKAKENAVIFRPHFKTHVSLEIGRWFKEYGTEKITVSSLSMAEYFADEWSDITVAFPINILEMDRMNRLSERITLNVLVESLDVVSALSKNVLNDINVFIKIDTGNNRTGLSYQQEKEIWELLKTIQQSDKLNCRGFLCHAGNSYACRGEKDIQQLHDDYSRDLVAFMAPFKKEYPDLKLSVGDTPTCSRANDFSWAYEIRPGNFVFFDVMQWVIGSNHLNQIAVAMACPIVAKHKERNQFVIYGGAIHFARDSRVHPFLDQNMYGLVVHLEEEGWSAPTHKDYFTRISQEHGVLQVSDETFDKYKIGDIIGVLPIHSCMTANLMKKYLTLEGEWIDRM